LAEVTNRGGSKGDLGAAPFKSLTPCGLPNEVHHADILTEVRVRVTAAYCITTIAGASVSVVNCAPIYLHEPPLPPPPHSGILRTAPGNKITKR